MEQHQIRRNGKNQSLKSRRNNTIITNPLTILLLIWLGYKSLRGQIEISLKSPTKFNKCLNSTRRTNQSNQTIPDSWLLKTSRQQAITWRIWMKCRICRATKLRIETLYETQSGEIRLSYQSPRRTWWPKKPSPGKEVVFTSWSLHLVPLSSPQIWELPWANSANPTGSKMPSREKSEYNLVNLNKKYN